MFYDTNLTSEGLPAKTFNKRARMHKLRYTHHRLTLKRRASTANSTQKTTDEYGLYSSPEAASPAPQRPRDGTGRDVKGRTTANGTRRDGTGRGQSRPGPPRAVPSTPTPSAPPRHVLSRLFPPGPPRTGHGAGWDRTVRTAANGTGRDKTESDEAALSRPASPRPAPHCAVLSFPVLSCPGPSCPDCPRQVTSSRGPRLDPKSDSQSSPAEAPGLTQNQGRNSRPPFIETRKLGTGLYGKRVPQQLGDTLSQTNPCPDYANDPPPTPFAPPLLAPQSSSKPTRRES